MILTKQYIEKVIEDQGWYVGFCEQKSPITGCTENYAELSFYSNAGENFCIEVFYDELDNFPKEVMRAASDFDPEEHVAMWLDAKRNGIAGVPSIHDLVHDADDIQENLDDLATVLCENLEILKAAKEDCTE